MTNGVSGSTIAGQTLTLNQSATGGGGGNGINGGGAAGNATSALTATNPGGGDLVGTSSAQGGGGGSSTNSNGTAGGNATASINLSGSSNVTSTASASGGLGGSGAGGANARAGGASAVAAASASNAAYVSAQASNQNGSTTALGSPVFAEATGTAPSGNVTANASSSGRLIRAVQANAQANVGGTDTAESHAAVAAPIPSFPSGLQAVAFATGLPSNSDARAAVVGNPNVAAAFQIGGSSTMLNLVTLSSADSGLSSQAYFTIDVSSFTGKYIKMGLINPHSTGNGFNQLRFQLSAGGNTVVDQTFTSLAAALAFFNDQVVNLGPASLLGNQPGNLVLTFTVSTSPGNRFYASMLTGTVTHL
jgi:hypothetical protein